MKIDPTENLPTENSAGSSWINWYDALVDNYGKKQANSLFLEAWTKRGSYGANTAELRARLSDNGVKLEVDGITATYEALSKTVSSFNPLNMLDGVGDVLKMGKYAVVGVGVLLLAGITITVIGAVRNPRATANNVSRLTPYRR